MFFQPSGLAENYDFETVQATSIASSGPIHPFPIIPDLSQQQKMDSYPGYAARSRKADALLQAGAVHVIATEEKSVEEEIKRLTEGKEARVVFDAVGGPSFAKLVSLTATDGLVLTYGGCKQRNELVPGDSSLAAAFDHPWFCSEQHARR